MTAGGAAALRMSSAWAAPDPKLIAKPPEGFTPLSAPGKVVKVTKGTDFPSLMQPNQLWPKADVARVMVERALTELAGASNAGEAMKKFIHPSDIVAIKVNGIAGQKGYTMAVNYEIIRPVVEAVLAAGVPPEHVTVFEQYPSYLVGTRLGIKGNDLPKGVKSGVHGNQDATMRETVVYAAVKTRYVRFVTEATAVIDMTMMKDHSICGFTGALKNMTHGQIVNPQDHHATHANPQIAVLYAYPILKSRVRLHLTDAFKITYDGGPLDKKPDRRIPHGAIYASTDPVALDTVGWGVIEDARKANGLPTLTNAGREPTYIHSAAELGLGVADKNAIQLRQVAL
ncbi:MAG TPA: DUF362 domain-containing protein [Polyangiaceae bacterium]|nr:DUF362 domain-containing protein [Polyangiaceae bacterium]